MVTASQECRLKHARRSWTSSSDSPNPSMKPDFVIMSVRDDFAKARNYALEKSSGDWILYLDADERVNRDSINELKKITSRKEPKAYYCRILNIDDDGGRPSVMNYIRLFPKSEGVRFEGKVHEQIINSLLKENYDLVQSGINITHIGYNLHNQGLEKKAVRNLKILLKGMIPAEKTNKLITLN